MIFLCIVQIEQTVVVIYFGWFLESPSRIGIEIVVIWLTVQIKLLLENYVILGLYIGRSTIESN